MYRRYSDDIIIVCPKQFVKEIEDFIQEKITNLNLEIQKTKTERRYFFHGPKGLICLGEENRPAKLQYLGVELFGEKIILRHKGYARFERRMKSAVVSKILKSEEYKTPLFKRKIYETYSPLGKKNYFSYIKNAHGKLKKSSFGLLDKQTGQNRIMKKINKKIKKEIGPKTDLS